MTQIIELLKEQWNVLMPVWSNAPWTVLTLFVFTVVAVWRVFSLLHRREVTHLQEQLKAAEQRRLLAVDQQNILTKQVAELDGQMTTLKADLIKPDSIAMADVQSRVGILEMKLLQVSQANTAIGQALSSGGDSSTVPY